MNTTPYGPEKNYIYFSTLRGFGVLGSALSSPNPLSNPLNLDSSPEFRLPDRQLVPSNRIQAAVARSTITPTTSWGLANRVGVVGLGWWSSSEEAGSSTR